MNASRPIVIVTGDFVRTGGMDRANLALASFALRDGREVHLVAHRIEDSLRTFSNLTFHRVARPLHSHLLGAPLLARAGRRVARSLSRENPIVIVNGGNCRWPGANWVHYVHAAFEPQSTGSVVRRWRVAFARQQSLRHERAALRLASLVIANSNRTARDLIERLQLPSERVRTVYYGTDAGVFHPATDDERSALRAALGWPVERRIALFIGAMSDRRKGFDTLFTSWQMLCRNNADLDLIVIGQGSELSAWQARTRAAGLSDRIRFLGHRSDVPDLIRAADLLIAPTRYEAYGLGVHEAICCGLPAIVSRSAGIAERFPPQLADLLLDDLNDAAELLVKVQLWLARQTDFTAGASALGDNFRLRSWDDMAREILQIVSN